MYNNDNWNKRVEDIFVKLGIKTVKLFDDNFQIEEHSLADIFTRIEQLQKEGKLLKEYEWSYILINKLK